MVLFHADIRNSVYLGFHFLVMSKSSWVRYIIIIIIIIIYLKHNYWRTNDYY